MGGIGSVSVLRGNQRLNDRGFMQMHELLGAGLGELKYLRHKACRLEFMCPRLYRQVGAMACSYASREAGCPVFVISFWA